MIDEKEVKEALGDDFEKEMDAERIERQSNVVIVKGYYKGYSISATQRNTSESMKPFLEAGKKAVEWMEANGFKPSWNEDTNGKFKPVTKDAPVCGIHKVPMTWKTGTSKTTGKPYAFWACGQRDEEGNFCNFKPEAVKKADETINF